MVSLAAAVLVGLAWVVLLLFGEEFLDAPAWVRWMAIAAFMAAVLVLGYERWQ